MSEPPTDRGRSPTASLTSGEESRLAALAGTPRRSGQSAECAEGRARGEDVAVARAVDEARAMELVQMIANAWVFELAGQLVDGPERSALVVGQDVVDVALNRIQGTVATRLRSGSSVRALRCSSSGRCRPAIARHYRTVRSHRPCRIASGTRSERTRVSAPRW